MATKDSLGDRMKDFYEDRYRFLLPRRTNILIRIDGKAFHTYTRGLKRPHDIGLSEDMDATTKYLCENIQGAKMGYVQSDEISILLTDYDTLDTSPWFDHNLQKMCSIAASLATAKFNQLRMARASQEVWEISDGEDTLYTDDISKFKLAMFDARIFVIPEKEEVINYFIWRQQDATRNSISMAAQSMFSHKELQGKSSNVMQDMMMTQKGTNWNDYPSRFKRGGAVVKVTEMFKRQKGTKGPGEIILQSEMDQMMLVGAESTFPQHDVFERSSWKVVETPIFTADRNFIKNLFPAL